MTSESIDFSPLHQRLQWYVDEGILPHAFSLVMRGSDVLDYRCFGYMDVETKQPLREDAIYRMFSNSKLVTSVAAMMLVEAGQLSLDDALADYVPVFANPQVLIKGASSIDQVEAAVSPITVRQILSHSAGFSYGFVDPESVIDQAYLGGGLNILDGYDGTLADMCEHLAQFPLAFQPGTDWRYSLGTDVTGHLVEIVSGQSFDEFLRQRIFEPLGMHDTGFGVGVDKLERIPAMYAPGDMFDPMAGGLNPFSAAGSRSYEKPSRWLSGGGGLLSSVADYTTFLKMRVNGGQWNDERLLQADTLQLMRTNQCAQGVGVQFPMWPMPHTRFGLGFALKDATAEGESEAALGEYHWGGMAGTHSWMSPASGITGFCGTQLMPGFWHPFSHDFKRLVYQLAG
jgi:CubicO group peptidase (beta-lactamase class C family)